MTDPNVNRLLAAVLLPVEPTPGAEFTARLAAAGGEIWGELVGEGWELSVAPDEGQLELYSQEGWGALAIPLDGAARALRTLRALLDDPRTAALLAAAQDADEGDDHAD